MMFIVLLRVPISLCRRGGRNLTARCCVWCSAILFVTVSAGAHAAAQVTSTSTPPIPQISPTPSLIPQASPTPSLERRFLKNILSDQRAIWTSPFHLDRDDAKWLVPLGLSTAGLIAT